MKSLKFFLEIKIIQDINVDFVYLVQDAYIDKSVKNYQINTTLKTLFMSLSQINKTLNYSRRTLTQNEFIYIDKKSNQYTI